MEVVVPLENRSILTILSSLMILDNKCLFRMLDKVLQPFRGLKTIFLISPGKF